MQKLVLLERLISFYLPLKCKNYSWSKQDFGFFFKAAEVGKAAHGQVLTRVMSETTYPCWRKVAGINLFNVSCLWLQGRRDFLLLGGFLVSRQPLSRLGKLCSFYLCEKGTARKQMSTHLTPTHLTWWIKPTYMPRDKRGNNLAAWANVRVLDNELGRNRETGIAHLWM